MGPTPPTKFTFSTFGEHGNVCTTLATKLRQFFYTVYSKNWCKYIDKFHHNVKYSRTSLLNIWYCLCYGYCTFFSKLFLKNFFQCLQEVSPSHMSFSTEILFSLCLLFVFSVGSVSQYKVILPVTHQ